MYSEKVMEHFQHPHNMGEIENPDGVGEVGNPSCGDVMKIYIKVDEDHIISDISFQTFGCGAAIASSSMVTTTFPVIPVLRESCVPTMLTSVG